MTTGEDNSKKEPGRGFAGLSSLLSDVDASLPPASREAPSDVSNKAGTRQTATQHDQSKKPPSPLPFDKHTEPSVGPSVGKWVLGIATVLGVLCLIGVASENSPPQTSVHSPTTQTGTDATVSAYSAPPAKPEEPDESEKPSMVKPPIGQNLVLSIAQIRYCIAEDIWLDSAKAAVNNYIHSDVDRYNAAVADRNSRCGQYRYRSGDLESARQDINPYRSQLQANARLTFTHSEPPRDRSTPNAAIQDVQRKLNSLGYDAGTADGAMGSKTRSAIAAFQRDSGLAPDSRADVTLSTSLNAAVARAAGKGHKSGNRSSAPEPSAPPRAQMSAPTAAHSNPENYKTCISGSYPSLCKHSLLTSDEAAQVAAAERRANFQTCISGSYPSLCKHSLLTSDEATQVVAAERRANFQTCISGSYPSLCKHSLLTSDEATQVAAAERRANFQTCISGSYPSLCKHSLLTSDEATQVAAAERRANFQTCISGNYPSLCKHALLTSAQAERVSEAEKAARGR